MTPIVRIHVDLDAVTDEAFEFVVDPKPSRNDRPIIKELSDFNPDIVDVLECMVLDGTEERQDVADYVTAVFARQES